MRRKTGPGAIRLSIRACRLLIIHSAAPPHVEGGGPSISGAYQHMIILRSMPTRRRLTIAALGALALPGEAAAYQAQDTNTVGPAEIRDFSLPGSRPAQPEPEPTIAPVAPPVAQPQPPAASPTPAPTTSDPPATSPPAPASNARATRAPARTPPRTATRAVGLPESRDLQRTLPPAAASVAPAPETAAPLPEAPPATEEASEAPAPAPQPESGFPWLYLLLAAGAALLAFFGWWKFRSAGLDSSTEIYELNESASAPQPEPAAAAAAEAAAAVAAPAQNGDVIGIVMRPWLELEFKPDRATATGDGAGVQYEVTIRNVGNAPARNVRLAAQMFNAGPELDKEIAGFFARGVDEAGAPPLTLLPRTEVTLRSTVSMARADMREIKVQGRSLFIPTVAFNLLYNWGRDKAGQTCSSHVVGREPDTPSEKMAPFRLDLGPRIYRSVGQRPSALARAV